MKKRTTLPSIGLALMLLPVLVLPSPAQYVTPAVLDTTDMETQLDYIQERTRIYNDYRAIREDMFQKFKGNVLDSLNSFKLQIATLNSRLAEREFTIETLNSDLNRANNDREEAYRNRDSLTFLGIQMKKGVYNTIMWCVVLGLAVLSAFVFLLFKRSRVVTVQSRKELKELQEEHETYRKTSREKYEKLVVNHHNEIMKLKRG